MATLTSYLTPGPFQPGSSTDRRTTYRAPGPLQPLLSVAYNVTASGGLTLGGTATASLAYSVTASGGLTLGGSATASLTYSVTASSGLTLGGSATASLTYSVTASSGLTLGGSAIYSAIRPILVDASRSHGIRTSPVVSGQGQRLNPAIAYSHRNAVPLKSTAIRGN